MDHVGRLVLPHPADVTDVVAGTRHSMGHCQDVRIQHSHQSRHHAASASAGRRLGVATRFRHLNEVVTLQHGDENDVGANNRDRALGDLSIRHRTSARRTTVDHFNDHASLRQLGLEHARPSILHRNAPPVREGVTESEEPSHARHPWAKLPARRPRLFVVTMTSNSGVR